MSAAPSLGKDLVGLEELSADQVRLILDTAEPFKEVSERPIKKVPALRGKTIVNLFFEASTRTRISFEFAEKRLSADTVNVATAASSVSKGETLVDTARNLEAMRIDMVVIRHGASGAAQFLGQRIRSNVINAGDGKHEHPTQGLLDMLTLRDRFGGLHSHCPIAGQQPVIVAEVRVGRGARAAGILPFFFRGQAIPVGIEVATQAFQFVEPLDSPIFPQLALGLNVARNAAFAPTQPVAELQRVAP